MWHGAVGGLFGGIIGQALVPKFQYGPGTKWTFFFIIVSLTIPIAAVIGAFVGAMIWGLHIWTKRNIGMVVRAILGGLVVGAICAFQSYFHYDDIQRSIVGLSYVRDSTVVGVLIGIVAGIVAGSQKPQNEPSAQAEIDLLERQSRSGSE